MIAVGCKLVESKTTIDIQSSLYSAYANCRHISRLQHWYHTIKFYYIHCYDTKKHLWQLIGSIPENASRDSQPSVAVVDNKIIVMRNSETVHIGTID